MAGRRRGAARWPATVWLATWALGCSLWRDEPQAPSSLPAARMSPDTVVLDIFTVEAAGDYGALCDELWRQLDETHLSPERRVRLAANGLRCGRCGLQLPPPMCELLQRSLQASLTANSFDSGAPGTLVQRRLQSRSGRRGRIALSGPHEQLEVEWSEGGQPRGDVVRQASCVMAVRTFPLGDGRVRVELTPEIEHGAPKQRLIEGDGALRWEPTQDRRVYDDLCMESVLAPGQTVVLSATPTLAGLGRPFFVRDTAAGPRPVFLIVRVAQTQHDDRFAPEQVLTPLVTPVE